MVPVARPTIGNKILAALPHEVLTNVQQHLVRAHFEKSEVVYMTGDRIEYAYFPVDGLLSLVSTTENGSTAEIAMVGREGMLGHPVILKHGMTPYEVSA